jgi:hypothetical protein
MPDDIVTVKIVADASEMAASTERAAGSVEGMGERFVEASGKIEKFGGGLAHISSHIVGHTIPGMGRMATQIAGMGEAAIGVGPVLAALVPVAAIVLGVELFNKLQEAELKVAEAAASSALFTAKLNDKLLEANERLAGLVHGPLAEAVLKLKDLGDKESNLEAIIKASDKTLETSTSTWKAYVSWVQKATDVAIAYAKGGMTAAIVEQGSQLGMTNTQYKSRLANIEAEFATNKQLVPAMRELNKLMGELGTSPEGLGQMKALQEVIAHVGQQAKVNAKDEKIAVAEVIEKKKEAAKKEEEEAHRIVREELAELERAAREKVKLMEDAAKERRAQAKEEKEMLKEWDKEGAAAYVGAWKESLKTQEKDFEESQKNNQQAMERIKLTEQQKTGGNKGLASEAAGVESLKAQMEVVKAAMAGAEAAAGSLWMQMYKLENQMATMDVDSPEYKELEGTLESLRAQYDKLKEAQAQWGIAGQKIILDQQRNAINFKTEWKSAIDTTTNAFNSSFTSWVVHGGSAMKMLTSTVQAAETQMIGFALKTAEKKIALWIEEALRKKATESATTASSLTEALAADKARGLSLAGLAGAGGTASMAAAPFPIDATAPAFGASMAAAAAGFSMAAKGGISEGGMTMLHPHEMVLPPHISEFVQRAASGGGTPSPQHTTNIHYAPTINGNASKDILKGHSSEIAGIVRTELRRTNQI